MVHDLEEVLAIEAARSGQTTGEATTVLQSLSGDTADFAPIRLRRPKRALALTLFVLALLAVTAIFLAQRTEKGTGGTVVKKPAELSEVRLAGDAAHDYDPAGDGHESEDATRYAIDGIRGTRLEHRALRGRLRGQQQQAGRGHLRGCRQADRGTRARAHHRHAGLQGPGLRLGDRAGVDQRLGRR